MAKPLDASTTFRSTTPEKNALTQLAQRRGAEMAQRGEVPDDTVNGYLRSLIRREAKVAGIEVDAPPAAPAPPAPAKPARRPRRG